MSKIDIKIKKLSSDAAIPQYAKDGDAGFDLYSVIDNNYGFITIKPYQTKLIKTGLSMEIPSGYEVQIRPRSGLSLKTKLRIANSPGTIDTGYRGEIGIIFDNISDEPITIRHHERIAQGVLCKVPQANFILVNELSETERGEGGFGHTGTN